MEQVASDNARKNLRTLLDRVARGETLAITRYGRPEVIMVPPDVWERMTRVLQADKDFTEILNRAVVSIASAIPSKSL